MQEQCLSEEKEADLEDKTVTTKEWFGEDYGVVLRHVEQNSSEESFVEKTKKKRKFQNCSFMGKEFEEDKSIKIEQRKHTGFEEKSDKSLPKTSIKTPGPISTNKKISEKGKSKARVKLYLLSYLLIISVLCVCCICYPQCCDYYREYQIVTYTGGTRPT